MVIYKPSLSYFIICIFKLISIFALCLIVKSIWIMYLDETNALFNEQSTAIRISFKFLFV
jgi:hypothetical protein